MFLIEEIYFKQLHTICIHRTYNLDSLQHSDVYFPSNSKHYVLSYHQREELKIFNDSFLYYYNIFTLVLFHSLYNHTLCHCAISLVNI